jgi:hypothetical protein
MVIVSATSFIPKRHNPNMRGIKKGKPHINENYGQIRGYLLLLIPLVKIVYKKIKLSLDEAIIKRIINIK